MKKLLLPVFILFIALNSCTMMAPKYIQHLSVLDYGRYYDQGFFLTESNSINSEYKPVGSVIFIFKGDKNITSTSTKYYESNQNVDPVRRTVRSQKQKSEKSKYEAPREVTYEVAETKAKRKYSIYDALDELILQCKEMGGNGIINLKIVPTYDKDYGSGFEITGMAVTLKQ